MDAASLEQMNKLRKSLGLPLLSAPGSSDADGKASTTSNGGPRFKDGHGNAAASGDDDDEPGSTLESREAAGFDNYKQVQDAERKRIEREKRKKAIQTERELAARKVRLEGKGLGDLDEEGGDVDAKAWLRGQKKRQKDIEKERARRLEDEIAERERLAALEYTSKDLAGVKVAHELGDFDDGVGEQILTLKDQEIGEEDEDDEGDMLENADIIAKDRLNDKLDLKKKIAYDVHDTENRELLSQYDDKKRKAFTLDASGDGLKVDDRDTKRLAVGDRLKDLVSLDILKQEPVSDYQEIKIKKPKKTKKNKRRKDDDDEDIFPVQATNGDEMDVDQGGPTETLPKTKTSDSNFNDDDDIASALSFTRRAALKKQKKKAADIIRELREGGSEDADPSGADTEHGLALNDTTTFLDNLAARPLEDEEPEQKVQRSIEREPSSNDDSDAEMGEAVAVGEDEEELLDRLRQEQSTQTPQVPHTGLDDEKSLDQGLGAALNLLRQRGLVKTGADNGAGSGKGQPQDKNKLYRDRQNFIIEAKLREHDAEVRARQQRERDRASGKMANMSAREREEQARWANTQREHQTSIAAAAAFNKEYKPDVNIKYVDDDGRLMNAKEAFKHLSHKFHGKGSGKGKTEKHLKKVAEEKRREARSVLDASEEGNRGYEGAAQHQRKGGQAGVRLQ